MLDFNLATKTTGSRFVFVKNQLAQLERAISNFMIDTHTQKNGYTEISPPLIATADTMYGTGQLPKFENDQFEIKLEADEGRKFLIPTAEVILTNIVKNQIINKDDLPIRVVASTPCFRKEAGSYGKDTKGMIRQHQFYKVELVSIVENDQCADELERMSNAATMILDELKLPYRKIILCTGDMGFSAEKTYDIEVWLPSENRYREISSCSSCGSFQARRMKARYKDKNNSKEFFHFIGGLQTYLPDAMLLFAPYVNSYRRFVIDASAPINTHWGIENRTVAFRVPTSQNISRRVENRIPGSDTNPYLAIAASLACGLLGLKEDEKLKPKNDVTLFDNRGEWTMDFSANQMVEENPELKPNTDLLKDVLNKLIDNPNKISRGWIKI